MLEMLSSWGIFRHNVYHWDQGWQKDRRFQLPGRRATQYFVVLNGPFQFLQYFSALSMWNIPTQIQLFLNLCLWHLAPDGLGCGECIDIVVRLNRKISLLVARPQWEAYCTQAARGGRHTAHCEQHTRTRTMCAPLCTVNSAHMHWCTVYTNAWTAAPAS